jgi:hypothetical protein
LPDECSAKIAWNHKLRGPHVAERQERMAEATLMELEWAEEGLVLVADYNYYYYYLTLYYFRASSWM